MLKSPPKNVISDENEIIHEHTAAFDTRKIENGNELREKTLDTKHSPPTKQVSSSKNVRFKDDVQWREENRKRPESLPKQLSHSDGKVSDSIPIHVIHKSFQAASKRGR